MLRRAGILSVQEAKHYQGLSANNFCFYISERKTPYLLYEEKAVNVGAFRQVAVYSENTLTSVSTLCYRNVRILLLIC
jgi:hypothetical protein